MISSSIKSLLATDDFNEMVSSHVKSSSAGDDFTWDEIISLESSPQGDDSVGDDFISCEVISCGRWFRWRWHHLGEIRSGRRWFHERWNHPLYMFPDDFFGDYFGSISGVLLRPKTIHKVIPKWAPERDPQFSISLAFQRLIGDSWVPFRAHFWVRFGVSLGTPLGPQNGPKLDKICYQNGGQKTYLKGHQK